MTVKGITRIVSCAVVALMAFTGCKDNGKTDDVQRKDIDTIPMMVQQIKECSRLYTAEYKVHKIVTHSDTTKISGKILGKEMSLSMPGGRRKVAIPIDATLKAYIDFADFSEDNVTRDGDMIRITLPNPHVVMTSSRIDHEGIKKYVSLIRRDFSDEELSHYEKQGRADIIADIPKLGILGSARRSAATQLLPIISMLGIKQENIIISFVEPGEEKGGLTWIMD
jgi:hypothetical protein